MDVYWREDTEVVRVMVPEGLIPDEEEILKGGVNETRDTMSALLARKCVSIRRVYALVWGAELLTPEALVCDVASCTVAIAGRRGAACTQEGVDLRERPKEYWLTHDEDGAAELERQWMAQRRHWTREEAVRFAEGVQLAYLIRRCAGRWYADSAARPLHDLANGILMGRVVEAAAPPSTLTPPVQDTAGLIRWACDEMREFAGEREKLRAFFRRERGEPEAATVEAMRVLPFAVDC